MTVVQWYSSLLLGTARVVTSVIQWNPVKTAEIISAVFFCGQEAWYGRIKECTENSKKIQIMMIDFRKVMKDNKPN